MNVVGQYQSITNDALVGLKNVVSQYYHNFPGLYPYNVKIGIFPQAQRYPAVSVNPRSSTFVEYLSGNKYYCSRDFELAFWVDQTTKNPERVLHEYSHEFISIIRDREEFTIEDRNKRKQALNFEIGTVVVSDENLSPVPNKVKPGYRITIPIGFTSKNKVLYSNIEDLKEMRDDYASEEEISLYLFQELLGYKNTKLNKVREFARGQEAIPTGTGNTLIMRIDNSLLEHYQLGYDVANLALRFEVWSKLDAREEQLLDNIDVSEEVVQLLMVDPYIGGFAIDAFWQQVLHTIDVANDRPYFVSSVIFMVRISDKIKRKGV